MNGLICPDCVISLTSELLIEKLTDNSCRKIIVFGENKKEKQSYQYNKHKQRLFTIPFRITDNNSDIIVMYYNQPITVPGNQYQVTLEV
jgi:hypothetical protein